MLKNSSNSNLYHLPSTLDKLQIHKLQLETFKAYKRYLNPNTGYLLALSKQIIIYFKFKINRLQLEFLKIYILQNTKSVVIMSSTAANKQQSAHPTGANSGEPNMDILTTGILATACCLIGTCSCRL